MINKPLVSVIIIFLNAEKFIQEAIESVLAQTYSNWELLLVDDGSTDGSSAIALECAQHYPRRAHYLEHEGHRNRGMSASRNLGIRQAKGEYIAFLDADDVWLPHKLEQQVAILSAQPEAALVYGPTQWWYSWTGRPEDGRRDFVHDPGVPLNTLVKPPSLLTEFLRNGGVSPCTCSVLIRRNVIERVGGFEDRFRGLYEDQAFFAKVCLAAPVFVASECWARYRQHPDSNCSIAQQTGQEYTTRLTFLNWLTAYLSTQRVKSLQAWLALYKALLPYHYPTLHRLAGRIYQVGRRGGRLLAVIKRLKNVRTAKRYLYDKIRNRSMRELSLPLIRHLRCLQFRRLRPLGNGRQRGTPIVRYYWAHFLKRHQLDICGQALEIGMTATIRHYGGQRLTQADAMDLAAHSPEITVVADLTRADPVPSDTYDCFVNQFTMHLIYDIEAALYHSIRVLKPGGVLLVNFPCVDYYFPTGLDMGTGAPLFVYWWFTPIQVENLLRQLALADKDYTLDISGNLFARMAYQMNMPAEELTRTELEHVDHGHPLLISARVVKPENWQATKPEYREPWRPEVTPARWNPITGHYAV